MFSVRKVEDTAILTLDSSIERGSKEDIENFKGQCTALQSEGIRNIILNMQLVENAPSIVLGTIIVLQKRLKNSDGNIAIANPTERMTKIFQITNMNKVIGIYGTEEDALNSLGIKSAGKTI